MADLNSPDTLPKCPGTTLLVWALTLCGILFVGFYVYKKFIRKDARLKAMMEKFEGPTPWPIFGNMFELIIPLHGILQFELDFIEKHGRLIRGWVFNQPYFFVADTKVVEKILSSNTHIDKSTDYVLLEGWLGTGLLTANGTKWHSRRRLLTPTFHFKILDDFLDIFNENAVTFINILEERADSMKSVNICPLVARCTMDVICETAMGEKLNAQRNRDSAYANAIHQLVDNIFFRIMSPWLWPKFIWSLTYARQEKKALKIVHDLADSVIRNRKTEVDTLKRGEIEQNKQDSFSIPMCGKRRLAFLDLLLEVSDGGKVLTDLDIREETDTFMFEGQDTTSASISWTIFLLAQNQNCQELVRRELFEIFGTDAHRHIGSADLARMKYLEYCIKESLRLFPSVPFIGRKLTEDLDLGDGKVLPKTSTIWIGTHALHRDPKTFPDPERFLPERFEPRNCVGRNPYSYVPFSAGPRNCIGQKFAMLEEKLILAKVFLNFKVIAAERLEDVIIHPAIILRAKNGLHVRFTKI